MANNTPPNFLTVHAAATYPSMDIGVKEITQWHLDRNWNTIGYHYVIRRDGTIEQGRPEHIVGAHVGNNNTKNIGICMAGGLKQGTKQPEDNFTDAQYASLTRLLTELHSRYPNAQIRGHNEFKGYESRGCPCFRIDLYREWITSAWKSLFLPDDWYSYDWKKGFDEDWNEVNIYRELPVVHTEFPSD